ncbi:hypothetical protein ACGFXC_10450 [Streptomyces sp. NPDC048507]|uniref:VG15 protein n=1 Tax=Streptomyces sp. NPDC048507 TaxID=3365560 RepID=UPI00371BBADB
MANAAADLLTREHREQALRVAGLIGRRLRILALGADVGDIDGWWGRVGTQMQQEVAVAQDALAALARRYLIAHAAANGIKLNPVVIARANPQQLANALRVVGPVAFKQHMAKTGDVTGARRAMAERLGGAGQRLSMEGSRNTVLETVRQRPQQIAGWRRVTSGSPCAFCSMVASRGAAYGSEARAHFAAHDNDRCSVSAVYRREPEPPEVQRLEAAWREATRGESGKDALNAFRRHLRGEDKATAPSSASAPSGAE